MKRLIFIIGSLGIGILLMHGGVMIFDTGADTETTGREAEAIRVSLPEQGEGEGRGFFSSFLARKERYENATLSVTSIESALPIVVKPTLTTDMYTVIRLDTGETILGNNTGAVSPIASLTKLVTAAVLIEEISPDTKFKIPRGVSTIEGTKAGFVTGETVSFSDMLHALLLVSGNDAAEAIAIHYGRDAFIEKMNNFVARIGANRTSFFDPSGLSPNNISTADDLGKITSYIYREYPEIFTISRERVYTAGKHRFINPTSFLNLKAYIGGKNGYTDEAGRTAISLFKVPAFGQTMEIAIVALQSEDRNDDILGLLQSLDLVRGVVLE